MLSEEEENEALLKVMKFLYGNFSTIYQTTRTFYRHECFDNSQ
jgi:hypothetical protein